MKNEIHAIMAVILSLMALSSQAAGDIQAGRRKAETCPGCHSVPNYANVYPQ